ncbi:MAG TPA: glycosyltransferase family 2 protein [Vicinamibacterales bacterium]|nr:glycosyltransferase family 2 protein [Vicinamibacterales bacterium]
MSRPFFTIAIPTKNRVDRLRNAVRGVLEQTFTDFEVIICDNSDDAISPATAAIAVETEDPRVRYVRTSGTLSMPDNWERSIADARGEYVTILTDRSVYRRDALSLIHAEIDRSGTPVVGWFPDSYGRDPAGTKFKRRVCSGERREFDSAELLRYFAHGHPNFGPKLLPKLMGAFCQLAVIERVRRSPLGRMCPPVCPDYTSGYLMVAHTDRIVLLDDSLYVSCGLGNGSAFRRRGPLADRFRRDLGMSWNDLVDRMPTDACFTHAVVLNDLMRLRETLPEAFASCDLDRPRYFAGCLLDYFRSSRAGVDLAEDYDSLIDGLNRESDDVQRWVRSRQVYLEALSVLPPERQARDGEPDPQADTPDDDLPRFPTVFDALEWGERTPRPVGPNVLLTMPSLETLSPFYAWRHRDASAGAA